jgi:Fe-S cluster assembly protein SufD
LDNAPAWAEQARQAAASQLEALPALTGREEAWRFTPPTDLALEGPEPEAPGEAGARPEPARGPRAARLALTDGTHAETDLGELPDGVIVGDLGLALSDHEPLVRERLYSLIDFSEKPGALNAARWETGTFVYVPKGVHLELPVEAVLSATGAQGRVFDRTLIVVDEGAKATVIDRYISPNLSGTVQASSAVELLVGQGGELEHIAVVGWGSGVSHHLMVQAGAQRDAKVRSVVVTLGGDVARVEAAMRCQGPGSDARALGLYFADDNQHFEHRVVSVHESSDAYSNLLYKGAIKDAAHTIFYGNLIVPEGSPRTDAYQTNRNLLLNRGARADTIPFRESANADVRCSHAGAVGRVDDEHLFYLSSRGVPKDIAKQLIVIGFLQEVLEEIEFDELRGELEAAVEAKVT